jgi:rsbT antagonist protein RsbS
MGVAVLRLGEWLIASVQAALSDEELAQLRDDLARRAGEAPTRAVIIDVSLLDMVDSYAARTLSSIAQVLRLRGAETVVVGIAPEVAFAMSQLGLTLHDAHTALDLDSAIEMLGGKQ